MRTPVLRHGLTATARHLWGQRDIDLAATHVADQLTAGTMVLPLTVFLGSHVYPVVCWDHHALQRRVTEVRPPILDRDKIRDAMTDESSPSPLSIVAFIGVGRPAQVRTELSGLRGLARTIGMFPRLPQRSPFIAEGFDAQGSTLVVVDDDHDVQVQVGGDGAAAAGSSLAPVWARIFEERLFWWALHTERWPEPQSATADPLVS